jgi:subtilisin family serine protease
MHGHGPTTSFSGIRRMPKEIAKFLTSQDWLFGNASADRPRVVHRRLRVEPLESRELMAVDAASLVAPMWFQSVASTATTAHAGTASATIESTDSATVQNTSTTTAQQNVYDWIVQFNTASLGNISSVAETAGLLTGGGVEFQIIEGLGLTGMVLARSSGSSMADVQTWLTSNVNVDSFEQDAVGQVDATPSDPQYSQLWGMTTIDASNAWNVTTGSASVVVAVIDTGVDYTHRDLAANIWTNPGEIAGNGIDDDGNGFIDDVHGYDFANNDGDPMDDNSHGTHVTGTIAAAANNGQGVAGVNWSSSIMALKFLNSDGTGYVSDAIRAVNYATMMRTKYGVNVRVMNNSWGGGEYSAALDSAIRASAAADILFVVAAGNDATNNDTTAEYPANYTASNIISVAAVDQNKNLASFSCYGATTVDVAAPGVSIYSTVPGNRYAIYSGTSMATPFVTGIAALAWAADPTATATEVRNAILNGVTHVSTLSGKVASGGVVNAYNTLKLLGVETTDGPAIGSLVGSPGSVSAGVALTLRASGITDSTGSVTSVSFVLDTNNNGQYDSTDTLLGSTSSISGGQASLTVSTTGWSAGSYRILARARDSAGVYSSWASASITVLPADDYGNTAATAATIAASSTTAGAIEIGGDVDWFKFQAVAGKSYVFTIALGTLSDSLLYLYDTNGAKQLALNDDYTTGGASQIAWTAPTSGVYYLAAAGYGSSDVGTYTLRVESSNAAPVLAAIGNRTLSYSQTTLSIALQATDADSSSLSYSVQTLAIDRVAQRAYALDQQLGLHTCTNGSYYTNARGAGEKYMLGTGDVLYFILPNGALYRWSSSIAKSTLVDTLSPAYYANPALLHNAHTPSLTSISSVAATISGNTLTIVRQAGVTDVLCVRVTVSDGSKSDSETFTVADPFAQRAYDLDQQLGLHRCTNGSYYTNARGLGEKYMLGTGDVLYYILPNGGLYRWGGSIAKSALVGSLSADYYANPSLLHDAQSPAAAAAAAGISAVSSASVRSVESVATVSVAATRAEASADAALRLADVAMTWLARESGTQLDTVCNAAVAIAPADALAVSLHDEALAGLAPGDSQDHREASATSLGRVFTRLLTEDHADSISRAGEWELIDSVFEMPTEMLLPSDDWLA